MAELKGSLESLSKKIAELHSSAVKVLLASSAIGVILLITFGRAVQQVLMTDLPSLSTKLQQEVNISGREIQDGEVCAWWDSVDVKPAPGIQPNYTPEGQAAAARAKALIEGQKSKCGASSPYVVQFKYFDYPFSFDLQYWAFALPPLFILAFGYLSWQWSQCLLLGHVGTRLLQTSTEAFDSISLEGALQFGSPQEKRWSARWAEWGAEAILSALFLSVSGVLFYRLSIIWQHLTSIATEPLIKLYFLLTLIVVSVARSWFATTRIIVERWSEPQAIPQAQTLATLAWIVTTARWLRPQIRPKLARVIALLFSVGSLFLACGMTGCEDTKLKGYQLLNLHQQGSWYFFVMEPAKQTWFGRSLYGLGVLLAILIFLELFRRQRVTEGRASLLRRLATIFGFLAFYELGWGDYLLIGGPILVVILLVLIWATRERGVLAPERWSEWGMFMTGLVAFTALYAIWNLYMIAKLRYYGVCAFCIGQVLLLFAWKQPSEDSQTLIQETEISLL